MWESKALRSRPEEVPPEVMQTVRRLIEAFREDDEPLPELPPSTRDVVTFSHEGEDGKTFSLPIRRESAGTITWLTTAWHALNVLRHGTLLLVDELDASLHPGLARYLVQLFLDPQMNPHGAQLIFHHSRCLAARQLPHPAAGAPPGLVHREGPLGPLGAVLPG